MSTSVTMGLIAVIILSAQTHLAVLHVNVEMDTRAAPFMIIITIRAWILMSALQIRTRVTQMPFALTCHLVSTAVAMSQFGKGMDTIVTTLTHAGMSLVATFPHALSM